MAVYRIFPEKDAFISSEIPTGNAGKDEIIEIGGYTDTTGLGQTNRLLVQYSTSEIQDVISTKIGTRSYSASLNLYLADAYEVPVNYTLYAYPIYGAWDNGVGKFGDTPINTTGVSWQYKLAGEAGAWLTVSYPAGVTGSYKSGSTSGGGNWYTGSTGLIPETVTGSVTIGTQTWSDTNLDVSTYRDGTPIPEVTDATAWAGLTTGAWRYYNNNSANGTIYGKLYNWYAVNDTTHGGLAPQGWHIPTDAEWTTLTNELGGEAIAGGELKEVGEAHWDSVNVGATDSVGFTALPGGYFYSITNGYDSDIQAEATWWSSTQSDSQNAWFRGISYNDNNVYRGDGYKTDGASVRLISDGGFTTGSINLEFTQSHALNSTNDININVTEAVKLFVTGAIDNRGFIIKLPNNLEYNTTSSIRLKYYGADTNTIYPPFLEFKWDDSTYNTGSLSVLSNNISIINLTNNKDKYSDVGKQRFRLSARPKYSPKTFTTSSPYLTNYALPSASYWGLRDENTEEMVVDFDTQFTKISCDSNGSFFDVYMDGLQPERYYRILVKTTLDGSTTVVDNQNIFKVVRNG